MNKGLLRRRRGFSTWGERGQALVEFGLVSIAFFFLTFGVFDLARLFQSWVTVQHASREAARYAITGLSSCDGDGADTRAECIIWVAKNATSALSRGGENGVPPDLEIETRAWNYDGNINNWVEPGVDGAFGNQCDQIEVIVIYRHKFVLPVMQAMAPSGVELVGRQRMTIEPYSPCGDPDDGV